MSAIEIKHLKMIKTIAQTENLTRAAQKLSITQSALSRQLLDIESRLGIPLFLRTKKRMILTGEGNSLLRTANSVLGELEKAELEISKIVNGETGQLKIGVECMFCFKWLPRVMSAFQERYPKVDLSLSRSQNPAEELKSGKTDLVVTARPEESENLEYHPLFEDEIAVIFPPGHPLSSRHFLTVTDLTDVKWISLVEKSKDFFYQNVLLSGGIEPKAYMHIEQVSAVVEVIKAGFGAGMLPRWSVRSLLESGQLQAVSFTSKGIQATWKAIHLKNGKLPEHQKELVRLLTDQAWVAAN